MIKPRFCSIALLVVLLTSCGGQEDKTAGAAATDNTESASAILQDAYLYSLPMVVMDITRRQFTGDPSLPTFTPVNQFQHNSAFPDATFRNVVRPNADTYYSVAWLDLEKEPLVLSLPDTKGRFYMMQMMDAYTNVFASPGTRTTGNKAGNFLVTGPGWSGSVPNGMQEIKSPTNTVWILGRTQVNSKEDGLKNVVPLQKKYLLVPLGAWGKPPTVSLAAAPDTTVPKGDPNAIVKNMPVVEYFNYANKLLAKNPPPSADTAALKRFSIVGVVPGKEFETRSLPADIQQKLNGLPKQVFDLLDAEKSDMSEIRNGWNPGKKVIGTYGTNYDARARIAYWGLGANLKEDAIYPSAFLDAENKPLTGANNYVLHFDKGQTPPAQAFWSLTMYDPEGYFVDNPINRYTLGDRSNLKYNADGSLDIYLQNQNPGKDKEANWLPAPKGEFNILMRVYWPKEEMINGSWMAPGIKKV